MPGARWPHARKFEQHKVWLKARTRHSNVLALVNKPSRRTPRSTSHFVGRQRPGCGMDEWGNRDTAT